MRALVTGATGFVGGHLARQLQHDGVTVTALVRTPGRAVELERLGVRLVLGDLDDHAALLAAAAGQDVVYHVAALTGAPDEASLMHANRDGTAHLVAAAQSGGVARFVLVSSAAAGGPASRGQPKRDANDDQPVTMYGRSKLAGELVVRDCNLAWSILRPPVVYGPGDTTNFLSVFRAVSRFGVAPVFGDGSQELSLVHVADLARACALAGTAAATIAGTFYVNHPETVTSRELVSEIGRAVGRSVRVIPVPIGITRTALMITGAWSRFLHRQTILHADKVHEFGQPAWTGDPARFVTATGWSPRFDLAAGLAETGEWYQHAKLI